MENLIPGLFYSKKKKIVFLLINICKECKNFVRVNSRHTFDTHNARCLCKYF